MKAKRLPLMNYFGIGLPCSSCELRLVVEEFELTGPAGHEEIDDALRLAGEVRLLGASGLTDRRDAAASSLEQRRQGQRAEAEGAWPKK